MPREIVTRQLIVQLDGKHWFDRFTGLFLARIRCRCGWKSHRHWWSRYGLNVANNELIVHMAHTGEIVDRIPGDRDGTEASDD